MLYIIATGSQGERLEMKGLPLPLTTVHKTLCSSEPQFPELENWNNVTEPLWAVVNTKRELLVKCLAQCLPQSMVWSVGRSLWVPSCQATQIPSRSNTSPLLFNVKSESSKNEQSICAHPAAWEDQILADRFHFPR